MIGEFLNPRPEYFIQFHAKHAYSVPRESGCYLLLSKDSNVMYVGKSKNLYLRLLQHWDRFKTLYHPEYGQICLFAYRLETSEKIANLERGWMGLCVLSDGELPPYNQKYAPI